MSLLMANTFNWPNAIAQIIESYGLSSRDLFALKGIPYPAGLDYSYKIELDELEDFLGFLTRETGDAFFILKMAQFFSPTMLDSFGVALMSSNSIEDAFNRTMKILGYVTDSIEFRLEHDQHLIELGIHIESDSPLLQLKSMILSSTQKLLQILVSPDTRFDSISLDFELDEGQRKHYSKVFQCPVEVNASACSARFDLSVIGSMLPGANNELAEINEKLFYQRLNKSLSTNITLQVKSALQESLPRGEFKREQIAHLLNIPSRSLQYLLEKEGVSFKEVLDATRYDMAIAYLKANKSITETAHLLGYSDTSNFTRAFKKWKGVSPKAYLASL